VGISSGKFDSKKFISLVSQLLKSCPNSDGGDGGDDEDLFFTVDRR
jgi:hypothetical protein